MGIFIKDPETEKAVRKLAKRRKLTLTKAVHDAVLKDLEQVDGNNVDDDAKEDFLLAELHKKLKSFPRTGLVADKAFYDSLYEE
jgi:antitoxin VapB